MAFFSIQFHLTISMPALYLYHLPPTSFPFSLLPLFFFPTTISSSPMADREGTFFASPGSGTVSVFLSCLLHTCLFLPLFSQHHSPQHEKTLFWDRAQADSVCQYHLRPLVGLSLSLSLIHLACVVVYSCMPWASFCVGSLSVGSILFYYAWNLCLLLPNWPLCFGEGKTPVLIPLCLCSQTLSVKKKNTFLPMLKQNLVDRTVLHFVHFCIVCPFCSMLFARAFATHAHAACIFAGGTWHGLTHAHCSPTHVFTAHTPTSSLLLTPHHSNLYSLSLSTLCLSLSIYGVHTHFGRNRTGRRRRRRHRNRQLDP